MGFADVVSNGKFAVTTECTPPVGADPEPIKSFAAALAGSVSAVLASESEDGPRMSSLAACAHLMSAGAEPVLCLLTRDLNRIALQASILGAASMGVKNVLCLSGRHQALTSSVSARGVFDVDQVQLVRIADAMREEGKLADGRETGSPLPLVIGTDANPFADPIELQALATEKAVAAGADFVITCPVFNLDRMNAWVSHMRERGVTEQACIIASVMPLTSSREAVSLAEKYCHLDIGDDVVERLDAAQNKRDAGVHMAAETIGFLRKIPGIRGVHIAAGAGYKLAADVIAAAGLTRS